MPFSLSKKKNRYNILFGIKSPRDRSRDITLFQIILNRIFYYSSLRVTCQLTLFFEPSRQFLRNPDRDHIIHLCIIPLFDCRRCMRLPWFFLFAHFFAFLLIRSITIRSVITASTIRMIAVTLPSPVTKCTAIVTIVIQVMISIMLDISFRHRIE